MKEPMTDARRKQLYRIKKRKRRKQCIRVALRMAVLCFLVLFAVQKTADLLRVDDSDRMEDAEQSYSGQGGKTRTNTEKTWGVFGKADVLTQEDKLHSIEESDEYPDQLKELAEKNSETIDFVYDYPEMKDKKQTIDLSQEAKTDTVPLLLQWDERWGYETYGSDFLAVTGCGPTCLSMITCGLTGSETWNPLAVAQFSEKEGYYVPGEGTSWSLMTEGANNLGLTAENIPVTQENILAALRSGIPLICSMYPGDFTYTGHFIVLTGIDENGAITVNDPNSPANTKKHWFMTEILPQIRQSWGYRT